MTKKDYSLWRKDVERILRTVDSIDGGDHVLLTGKTATAFRKVMLWRHQMDPDHQTGRASFDAAWREFIETMSSEGIDFEVYC